MKITGFQELLMACGVIAKEPSGPGLDTARQIQGALDEVQFDFVEEFVNLEIFGGIGQRGDRIGAEWSFEAETCGACQRVVAHKLAGCLK